MTDDKNLVLAEDDVESFFERLEKRRKSYSKFYLAKLTFYRWWHHGWIDKIKPRSLFYRTKYFIQRGRRGWADCDTWSLDDYLSRVIGESVMHLADVQHGWPGEGSRWKNYEEYAQHMRDIASAYLNYADRWDQEMEDFHPNWRTWKGNTKKSKLEDLKLTHDEQIAIYRMQEARIHLLLDEMRELLDPDIWPHLWD